MRIHSFAFLGFILLLPHYLWAAETEPNDKLTPPPESVDGTTGNISGGEQEDENVHAAKISARYKALESLAQGLFFLENLYVDESKVDQDDLVISALKGMVGELDPHTVLMTKKDFEDLTTGTQGRFGGVGIIVSPEGEKLIVVSPIEDSPAEKAGVQAGDEVTAIDGFEVAKLTPTKAADIMRGAPGSTMTLTIKRVKEKKPLIFKLVREIINVKSLRTADLREQILYARISSFQENTYEELSSFLQKSAKNMAIKGLLLDLRDNPGGLLDQAVKVSDLFIESGIIVSTVGRDTKKVEREFASKVGTFSDFPIVTLVNSGSASASEIVAGALQDHKRSIIMGETTFGKGSVQTLISLPNGAGLKLTIARYYTPNDRSIQARGISPDIPLNMTKAVTGTKQPRKPLKESDLKGHIEAHDLSDFSSNQTLEKIMDKWPKNLQQDESVKLAYSYLRGMAILK